MSEPRRIFTRPRRPRTGWRALGRTALLVGALWLLFGCAVPAGDWAGAVGGKEVRAERVGSTIRVRFPPESDRLEEAERARLARFVGTAADPGGGGFASVRVVEVGAEGDLARRRIERLRELLPGLRGGPVSLSEQGAHRGAEPDSVILAAGRILLSVPACPDWSKPAGGDPTNTPSSNFGCASARNLAAMIAEPADLVAPDEPGPANAERLARAVERHRRGDSAPLDPSPTSAPGTTPKP